jgi:hypothetical protein
VVEVDILKNAEECVSLPPEVFLHGKPEICKE